MIGTMEVQERMDTPRGWSWRSAIIGAGVGAVLMKKALSIRTGLKGRRAVGSQRMKLALGSMALGVFASRLMESMRSGAGVSGTDVSDASTSGTRIGSMGTSMMGSTDRAESLAFPTGSRIPPMPPLDDLSTKTH